MIYVGHFSFKCPDRAQDADACLGYFTCIVEAESVKKAGNRFQLLLRRVRRSSTAFDELESVYLDSCIEIRSIPRNGFLAYFSEIRGDSLGGISTELIGVAENSKHVSAYHVVEHPSKEDAESVLLEPFLTFDR
jgi:hypothetical protein